MINPVNEPHNLLSVEELKQVVKPSKKSIKELRVLNDYPNYAGKELTKYQLIFQIIYRRDYANK